MSARRGGWECGECEAWWPSAVPTCIDCLVRDRDGAVNALAVMCQERDDARRGLALAFRWIAKQPDGRESSEATCAYVPPEVYEQLAAAVERTQE